MLWLLLFFSAGADLSGTWKVREPVVIETSFEVCRFRNVVAYVSHDREQVTGTYEALVSCNDPHWPEDEWRKRIGTLQGSVTGQVVTLSIDDALLVLEGRTDGGSISGFVDRGGTGPGFSWSARRLGH